VTLPSPAGKPARRTRTSGAAPPAPSRAACSSAARRVCRFCFRAYSRAQTGNGAVAAIEA